MYERYFINVPQICLKIVDNQNIKNIPDSIVVVKNICDILNNIKTINLNYNNIII
jgi:hypothetical protein